MKNLKKLSFIYVFGMLLFTSFLIPRATAQEWIDDGVDTTNIPGFSVYPSECYVYEPFPPPGWGFLFEIVKGNITVLPPFGIGTTVWGTYYGLMDITSGNKTLFSPDVLFGFWNKTLGFATLLNVPIIIPVESNGIVSLSILNNFSIFFELAYSLYEFEHHQIYPNIYSIAFWNTSSNAYYNLNYTDDGILTRLEYATPGLPVGAYNMTLYSQPAQLPPSFSFTTESGELTTNTTEIKLIANITDADNNNDGLTDTDYLYRIHNETGWTAWAPVTSLIDYDLGSVASGNYNISMEVKNMYGVTQKQITIQYTAPGGDGGIPSYPIAIISLVAIFSVSIIILIQRKKLRF